MGLCKCRNVTTLFCFEHRRNVCESCLLQDHSTCFVRTYLQWLQNSEYEANCLVCKKDFSPSQPTIRLSCYDVLHLECLERELRGEDGELPSLGKAACPICHVALWPTATAEWSPITHQLYQKLQSSGFKVQLPPPPTKMKEDPSTGIVKNQPQPNTITIDLGFVPSGGEKVKREIGGGSRRVRRSTINADGEKGRGWWVNWSRVMLNCLMMRNLRVVSLGFSPRNLIIVLLIMALSLVLLFNFVIPTLQITE